MFALVPWVLSVLRIQHGTAKLFGSLLGLFTRPILFCFVYLYLAVASTGPASLDALRRKVT